MATETNKIYVNDILAITIYESGMPSLGAEMNIIAENKTIKISEVYGGSLSSSASFDFAEGYSLASNGTENSLNYWIFNTPNTMSNYSGKFILTEGDIYLTSSNPYNIVIKNKEGIKLLTKDKTIEFTDDVKVTIDESLLGGGEAKKYNFTLTYFSSNTMPADLSIDGGDFTGIDYDTDLDSEGATGQANFLVVWSSGEIIDWSADNDSAKFAYIKQNESYPASCLVITLLKDNAVIHVEGED